jgi:glycosyltransferase involved in cell wall biosynthesis
MHIGLVLKKIDRSLLEYRSKYLFENILSNSMDETIIAPSEIEKVEKQTHITKGLILYTIPLNCKIPLIREIKYSLHLMRVLNTSRYDIINLNSHLQIWAMPVILSTTLSKIPLVVTIHGPYQKMNLLMDTIQKVYLHTFCRLLWIKAKAIICLTEADAKEIAGYGCPKEKITVIPNWVNTDLFRPSTEKRNRILWTGRFVSPKGLEYLVKAAQIVVSEHPNCKFVLIGDGPLKPRIEKMVSDLKLSEWFEFRGYLRNDKVAEEMAKDSIFAFPSLKEGMPYAILEAAASGMAIVASDIPSMRAVLKDGEHALLVKPEDHILLANAILRLLRSEELRAQIQKKARKLMEKSFAANIIIGKTIHLYENVIRDRSSSQ